MKAKGRSRKRRSGVEQKSELDTIGLEKVGQASVINYNVPLPGSNTGRRILKLDGLGIHDADWTERAKVSGVDLKKEVSMRDAGDGSYRVDEEKAFALWRENALGAGASHSQLNALEKRILSKTQTRVKMMMAAGSVPPGVIPTSPPKEEPESPPREDKKEEGKVSDLEDLYGKYINGLGRGEFIFTAPTWGGSIVPVQVNPDKPVEPALFLIEVYGISSFPGEYGAGKTVKTFTLLPGESTTISMRTWKSSKESITAGSSIVDSMNSKVADTFSNKIQNETTDKATKSSKEEWHVEAKANASWGWGSADVKAGASGEYHAGREEFAKQVDDTAKEHSNEASSSRELTVTSSSERTEERGEETVIERNIKNVNMRRTLNFVFRELNQEYITNIHLKEVRIAFSNGKTGSWREVALSGLRGLLQEVLQPGRVDEIAQKTLKLIGIVFDHKDSPVKVIEKLTLDSDGQNWKVEEAELDVNGEFAPPTDGMFYRFKRKSLGQEGENHQVDGVIMKQSTIVMRTDSVIVEALLGQADALDGYAMEIQEAAAHAKTLENEREKLAQKTLDEIADPKARAELYSKMFMSREKKE